MLISLIISITLILDFFVLPQKRSVEVFDGKYVHHTVLNDESSETYDTKFLQTFSNNKYILPDSFSYPLLSGDKITIVKSLLFSWPLQLQIKHYNTSIGILSLNPIIEILFASIGIYVCIISIIFSFENKLKRTIILENG